MTKAHILIIDDEPDIRELLEITISRMGLNTSSAATVAEALALLNSGSKFHLCLTDMKLPDGQGLDIIEHIQNHLPELPVAMITAFGSVETAISALKAGAFDFVNKPIDLERLRQLIETALKLELTDSNPQFEQVQLLGNAPAIQKLRGQINKLARSQAPVYISGESGSGKEVVARLIHSNGPRSSNPFIPVNCGAIPSELMESEFFGHVKGSFSGAIDNKVGLFEAANGGTLFLDEVADLPLPMQVKLLRAIQEKAIRKVGSNDEVSIDVRILSATHKDLNKEVEHERFRNDLFYRINVIELNVPPLRERVEDIPLLADFSLSKLAQEWQTKKPELSTSAIAALNQHSFPGNVRELENTLERAATLCEGNIIEAHDLQLINPAPTNTTETTNSSLPSSEAAFGDLDGYLEQIETAALKKALEHCRWNKTAAAELLGISFRQMRHRVKKLGLDDD
ncbi:sigma-54 dependent transcriptional regulator [Dasania sp. GY-MA-18]|uniref:Sigma-54 dependent transcriptional regulator n=1 Tax=Dasania phycosphaerae TaxID=2950436 RepID=A0A9J6RNF1_9GAMM|nr:MULTISPECIES: sigma-54 dependent transcriptional regulator [Dasania]MCR8923594.1 sigma-54 dependent transcriptional regulator [Dasania sp. GY-MA-18]MCZ0866028.1 sigma-54 dependent transcriptional regulator [Dasania phycosphaerae]MCZ0869752.1 sigma-54 dependent transcriptional regulator [Dasania phycosphaerae]